MEPLEASFPAEGTHMRSVENIELPAEMANVAGYASVSWDLHTEVASVWLMNWSRDGVLTYGPYYLEEVVSSPVSLTKEENEDDR